MHTIKTSKLNALINKLGVYFVILIFIVIGTLLFQDKFLSIKNFLNIVDALTLLGIVASGVAFVTYSGHSVDLSIPTTMAFSGIITIEALRFGTAVAIAAGLCTGLVIGLINAFAVGKLRVNPIIWTLAMAFVTKGLMRWAWSNKVVHPPSDVAQVLDSLYRIQFGAGISLPLVVVIVFVVLSQFVLTKTKFGKQLKVTGSSYDVAKMTGIDVTQVVGAAFVICALAASIAGIFITSLSKVGAYYQGQGYDFDAITGVVIGGVTLSGGRGDIIGVVGGVFLVGLLKNILTLLGIGTFSQIVMQGLLFIIVVGINTHSLRKLGRSHE